MTNKQITNVLGWIFLIAYFFTSYGANIICASIFFAANYIIKTIENDRG